MDDKWKCLIITMKNAHLSRNDLCELLAYIRPRLNSPNNKMVEVGVVLGKSTKGAERRHVKGGGFPPMGMELPEQIEEFDLSVQSILRGPVERWITAKMSALGFSPQTFSIERA